MELRCQNCGHRIRLDDKKTGYEFECPSCGVMMVVPRRETIGHEARPTQKTLRRVFEPIPKPIAYLAGTVIALVLTSPFWVYWLRDSYWPKPPLISQDTQSFTIPPPSTNTVEPLLTAPAAPATALDQFHGARLEAMRDDVERRFGLRLQNTRGMAPEIYEGSRVGDVEQVTAHFYENVLKEFTMVLRETRTPPEEAERQLMALFGPPVEHTVTETPKSASPLNTGLPVALGTGKSDATVAGKLATFPWQRTLVWTDGVNRVDATVYYSSTNTAEATSMVSVHVSAARWLEMNRPQMRTITPPAATGETTSAATPATETPTKLFP